MNFTIEQARALVFLAGFNVNKIWTLENRYWPKHQSYDDVRNNSPWFLLSTDHGMIEMGWRKRVLSIDWEGTINRERLIEDDVTTNGTTYIHAWPHDNGLYLNALSYLSILHKKIHEQEKSLSLQSPKV